MNLCKLLDKRRLPVAEGVQQITERFGKAVRGFVKDQGARFRGEFLQKRAPLRVLYGQKAFKGKPRGRQTRNGDGRRERRGAGDGLDAHAVRMHQGDKRFARVGNGGHPRVRDQRAAFPREHAVQNPFARRAAVVLVVADGRGRNFKMIEQLARDARVFGGDEIAALQRLYRPRRKIPEVADGRTDDIQDSRHRKPSFYVVCPGE